MAQRLAVVGAGPKGVAIAVKAAVLRRVGYAPEPPEVVVYEPDGVGAAWKGGHGYTDGLQLLCTPAERDLGFPYASNHGADAAQAMMAEYSWPAYAVRSHGRGAYAAWTVAGRPPPTHAELAAYLADSLQRSGAPLLRHRVTQLHHDAARGTWLVDSEDGSVAHQNEFDGVVITGHGPPLAAFPGVAGDSLVLNGRDFWARQPLVERALRADRDPSVVIVGAGGTAAAIARRLQQQLPSVPVIIIGREPTLYSRHSNPFEDRLFSDDQAWSDLTPDNRRAFATRLNAGVVWASVLRQIDVDNLQYESYDVLDVRRGPPLAGVVPGELEVRLGPSPPPASGGGQVMTRRATVVVDARGFNTRQFVAQLLGRDPAGVALANTLQRQVEELLDTDFCVRLPGPAAQPFPQGLHVPAWGVMQGPAAGNLMALGWVADRVLSRYC